MSAPNPYLEQVRRVLPRLLALYDTDPFSGSYGMGDRFRWAWGLIDFANATFQGAAHGLARLLAHGLLPEELSEAAVLRRIDAMVRGAETLRRRNGSLEESFPYESSFCVTALVAYDLLSAVELLGARLDEPHRTRYLDVVRPMIRFLHRADETHAFISNHLATAAAALYKWSALTGEDGEGRGRQLLDRMLGEQSEEGWFREYDGADPGYQTLCTGYLADLHRLRPDLGLLGPLRRSVQFLWHFAHPDGSFGGHYASRNTRFYFPAGLELLAAEIPEAAALARFMRPSIESHRAVTLDVLDEPNLIPMFNAYCWAAVLLEERGDQLPEDIPAVPAASEGTWRRQFPQAGLLIDKGEEHYTIVSFHKGGVCYHFPPGGRGGRIDLGVVARARDGRYYSTQASQPANSVEIDGDRVVVTAPLVAVRKELPTPLQFVLLRLLNVTLMRSGRIGNWVKKALVRRLITGKKAAPVRNRRVIELGADLTIADAWEGESRGFTPVGAGEPFSAVHMASQGYWQRQDDAE